MTAVVLAVLGGRAISAQDKYTVKVPGGLAFSEFRGYEGWQTISISRNEKVVAVILGNPAMIDAYRGRHSRQRQAFPGRRQDGEDPLEPEDRTSSSRTPTVPGTLHDVDFMVKDSKRFADSGGWGYAVFDYDAASDTFTPGTMAEHAAAGERRQVRVRVPHDREDEETTCSRSTGRGEPYDGSFEKRFSRTG